MRIKLFKLLILFAFCLASMGLHASDIAKEQRWADQIVDALITGEAEWLAVNDHKILAIYTESESDQTLGGAIILHGIGVHPDWPDVIHPLRTQLPETGWATLSIQMPILPNEATSIEYVPLFDEVAPRIDAAIKFLKQQGIENIVIIAHSLGTAMTSYYLSTHPESAINKYVGVSMDENEKDPHLSNVSMLKKINIPVLDIYGSLDQESVRDNAMARKKSAESANNSAFEQDIIEGANHFFNGKDEVLVKTVNEWLVKK